MLGRVTSVLHFRRTLVLVTAHTYSSHRKPHIEQLFCKLLIFWPCSASSLISLTWAAYFSGRIHNSTPALPSRVKHCTGERLKWRMSRSTERILDQFIKLNGYTFEVRHWSAQAEYSVPRKLMTRELRIVIWDNLLLEKSSQNSLTSLPCSKGS